MKSEYIALLKAKDQPMAVRQVFIDGNPINLCGRCEKPIADDDRFCSQCGQRIGHDNYQI